MFYIKLLGIFFLLIFGSCQKNVPPVIQQLKENLKTCNSTNEQDKLFKEFISKQESIPIVDEHNAIFIYKGQANTVEIVGDTNGWSPDGEEFSNIRNTDLWYIEMPFERNARLDYKFVINSTEWILDPLNPLTVSGGWGPNSELRMSAYEPAWEIESNRISEFGEWHESEIQSAILNRNYKLRIYLPYSYDSLRVEGYPVVYFQDGLDPIELGSLDIILDNLIEQEKMPPTIAVTIEPTARESEYVLDEKESYVNFFISELIPYIDKRYNSLKDTKSRAVCGVSYGANISARIAFGHPDIVGHCGVHSAAYQPENFNTEKLVINSKNADVNYIAIWGSYEGVKKSNRKIKRILEKENRNIIAMEYPEGHSWGLWRATTDEMLCRFFPPKTQPK